MATVSNEPPSRHGWLHQIRIIQGGMGVAISGWRLARAVAAHRGCMGVVSGTALDSVVARRLQDGDKGGHLRRAIEAFPDQGVAGRVLDRFFVPMGKRPGTPYRRVGMQSHAERPLVRDLTVLAAFVEVVLAREGHRGRVGINLMTKLRPPTLPTLYGAMLAGVDCILMGAGIPREIPGVLDAFAEGREASMHLIDGAAPEQAVPMLTFDPARVGYGAARLPRPAFLPIISADSLAVMLIRRATGSVEGFVVEGPLAGGHNAPPRGRTVLDETGQPVYGERDQVDTARMAALGLPFWLAGGTGSPEGLAEARAAGATGIQLGTLFAYAREFGHGPGPAHPGPPGRPRGRGRGPHRPARLLVGIPLQGGAGRGQRLQARGVRGPAPGLRQRLPARAGGGGRAASPTAAPPSRWRPTSPREGRPRTPPSAAASATACSPPPATPRCRRTGRWSRRSSPAATTWPGWPPCSRRVATTTAPTTSSAT